MALWKDEFGEFEQWFETRALETTGKNWAKINHFFCQRKSGGFYCYRLLKNMTTGSQWPDKGKKRNEPTSSRGSNAGAYLFGLITWPLAVILNRMPLGYEDEVGFHLGARSSRGKRGIGILAENQINPPQEQPQDDYPPSHRPE